MRAGKISEFIEAAVKVPGKWGEDGKWNPGMQAAFLHGPPGVGKSAIPRQAADEAKIGFLDTRAAQHDPTDFRGIPAVITEDSVQKAVWLPPEDIPFVNNTNIPEKGIWLLDEMTSAPPLVQAVLYQAVLDHQIGEHRLKEGWYVMAAGNRVEDRAVVRPLSTALANRFTHIDFEVNLDDWRRWAVSKGINTTIIAFLHWKSELLFSFNPESSDRAFCTPRSWEFADHILRSTPRSLQPELLEGTIGAGATAEFVAFLKVQTELPDLGKILAGDNTVPVRGDLRYALVAALVTKATGQQFERLLQYGANLPGEYSVLMAMLMVGKDAAALRKCPSWEPWSKANRDVLVRKRG